MYRALQFTPEYEHFILEQWQRFQYGEDVSDAVRPPILESWLRCRRLKVDVERVGHAPLAGEEYEMICQEEHRLLATASPVVQRIWERVRDQECLFSLANARGIMLQTWVGNWVQNILPGAYVQEKNVGTAGMASCLFTGKSITVYGAEHYCLPHHGLVCTASPILNPEGQLLGGLNFSCTIATFHPYCITILQEAARSITEQIRLQSLLDTETRLIESFSDGLLVVRGDGTIVRANSRARSLLSLHRPSSGSPSGEQAGERNAEHATDQAGAGRPEPWARIQDLFRNREVADWIREGREFRNEELRLSRNIAGPGRTACVASFTPGEAGGILSVRAAAEMHSYATRTVGSKAVYTFKDIVGQSGRMRTCLDLARKMAASDYTVLITGESGTGKELLAQSIHNASERRDQPFVAVNCGALPRELVQAELFGYVEGAFTGARKAGNPGKFELADGGTIFLDEIGEMSLDAQVSLLRLLQNGEVTRIGAHTATRVNVRVLAATNRNLAECVRQKTFREDLFYRLNVFTLQSPALREREDDVVLLAQAFLQRLCQRHQHLAACVFGSRTIEWMCSYSWPGNVRQLEHAVERAVFTAQGSVIQPEDFSESRQGEAPATESRPLPPPPQAEPAPRTLPADSDFQVLDTVLRLCEGRVDQAAARLGIGRSSLYAKLAGYGISARSYRRLRLKD